MYLSGSIEEAGNPSFRMPQWMRQLRDMAQRNFMICCLQTVTPRQRARCGETCIDLRVYLDSFAVRSICIRFSCWSSSRCFARRLFRPSSEYAFWRFFWCASACSFSFASRCFLAMLVFVLQSIFISSFSLQFLFRCLEVYPGCRCALLFAWRCVSVRV